MKRHFIFPILMTLNALVCVFVLSSCFGKKGVESKTSTDQTLIHPARVAKPAVQKDIPLTLVARYLQQADSIHREAWWVVSAERHPVEKSPFGKVQRAVLSEQNIKLSNKSLFNCDHYITKRNITNVSGYPQNAEVFEKCSEKTGAHKIAEWTLNSPRELKISFYPDNLQELLGLGASMLNRKIDCVIKGDDRAVLSEFNCQSWAQNKNATQMVRLDVYQYKMADKNLLILQGKVYDNLRESRKIEARVPMNGKIKVVETELFAPPEEPVKPVAPVAAVKPKTVDAREARDNRDNGQPLDPNDPNAQQPEPGQNQLKTVASPARPLPGVPVPMALPTDPSQMHANPQMPQDGDNGEEIPQEPQVGSAEQQQAGPSGGVQGGAAVPPDGQALTPQQQMQEQQMPAQQGASPDQQQQGEDMDGGDAAAQEQQQQQQVAPQPMQPMPQHPPPDGVSGGR